MIVAAATAITTTKKISGLTPALSAGPLVGSVFVAVDVGADEGDVGLGDRVGSGVIGSEIGVGGKVGDEDGVGVGLSEASPVT